MVNITVNSNNFHQKSGSPRHLKELQSKTQPHLHPHPQSNLINSQFNNHNTNDSNSITPRLNPSLKKKFKLFKISQVISPQQKPE
jgi:hypothetical protein